MTFHQQHVWEGYTGSPQDTVDVEVYQAWLKPATKAQSEQQQHSDHHTHQHRHDPGHHGVGDQHGDPHANDHGIQEDHGIGGHDHSDGGNIVGGQNVDGGQHRIGEQHGDPQAVDHGDHVHEGRVVVEQNAIDLEGQDDAERRRLSEALIQAKPWRFLICFRVQVVC